MKTSLSWVILIRRFLTLTWSLSFKCIIKEPTCYKNPNNSTYIDLILTNCPKNFQESLETGLSDFHKMVLTVFKSEIPNLTPKAVSYRKYKQ